MKRFVILSCLALSASCMVVHPQQVSLGLGHYSDTQNYNIQGSSNYNAKNTANHNQNTQNNNQQTTSNHNQQNSISYHQQKTPNNQQTSITYNQDNTRTYSQNSQNYNQQNTPNYSHQNSVNYEKNAPSYSQQNSVNYNEQNTPSYSQQNSLSHEQNTPAYSQQNSLSYNQQNTPSYNQYAALSYNQHDTPIYDFAYEVNDANTGDIKNQQESRLGDSVLGQYSFLQPDGVRRTVDYTADEHAGFRAIVNTEGRQNERQNLAASGHQTAPVSVNDEQSYLWPSPATASPAPPAVAISRSSIVQTFSNPWF